MLATKSVYLNLIIGKLSLFTSICCLTMAGVTEASPIISQDTSRRYLAQSETEPTATEPTATTNTQKPVSEERAEQPSPPSNSLENEIISEINRVRTDPQGYADWLESQKQYYQGTIVKLPGEQPIRTNRGLRRLEEAITFLRQQEKLTALSSSTKLISSARQRITNIKNNQTVKDRNNLVYGKVTPEAIVMQLIVDDGFPDRRNRLAIFKQEHNNAGIVCSEIPLYRNVCAIAYQEETTEVAQNPPETTTPRENNSNNRETNNSETTTKPEAQANSNNSTNPNNNQLPTPPDINTPITSESATTATIATTANANNSRITSRTATTNTQAESETTTTSETPESTVTTTETKPTSEVTDNPTTPSEANPKTPESTVTTTETKPESEATDNPTTPSESSPETPESEVTATATPETEAHNQTTSNSPTETKPESEVIVTTETPSESETEVATASPTNNTFEAIEIVEQGMLEEGDEVIPNDGSFYDSYPLDGSAGDSFTITLESKDFDTFLAIMDEEGNIIEQNDDANEQNSNSKLEITLPDNGTYSVIVNAYEQDGKGNYTLTVTP